MIPAGNTNRRLVRRTTQLFAGLVFYGLGMALMIESRLGLTSWDVFHQGLSKVTGLSFGWVVILLGVPILLLWIPLRQRPGFGTVGVGTLAFALSIGPLAQVFIPMFTVRVPQEAPDLVALH